MLQLLADATVSIDTSLIGLCVTIAGSAGALCSFLGVLTFRVGGWKKSMDIHSASTDAALKKHSAEIEGITRQLADGQTAVMNLVNTQGRQLGEHGQLLVQHETRIGVIELSAKPGPSHHSDQGHG